MEEPRFLAARSEHGYVTNPMQALKGEPEALTEDEQQAMTEAAARRLLDDRIRRRQATASEIEREIAFIDARGRYLRRQLRRLKRPL